MLTKSNALNFKHFAVKMVLVTHLIIGRDNIILDLGTKKTILLIALMLFIK